MALVPEWGIELGRYFKAVLVWWVKTVGGSIVAFFQIFYALNYKQAPPVISWCLLGVCFTVAGFLAWRDEYKRAERLQSRMKSRIRVSCGKSVNQSVVSADGEMWYRARLDLEGYTPIPDIEATVTELWEDGKRVLLQECLTLTMYPGNLVVITQSVEKRSDCGQWICDEAGNVIETQEEGHSRQTIHARQLKLAVKDE